MFEPYKAAEEDRLLLLLGDLHRSLQNSIRMIEHDWTLNGFPQQWHDNQKEYRRNRALRKKIEIERIKGQLFVLREARRVRISAGLDKPSPRPRRSIYFQ